MDIFMQAAIDEALEGLSEGKIPIGAVLVENSKIIGRGRNRRVQQQDLLMHAEIDCLRHARLTGGYNNTTLYSTHMPCYLCAGTVVQFGIKKVVVGDEKSAPAARDFMEEYIHKNGKLWDEFLSELNPDLLKPSGPHISIRHHLLPGDVGYITYLHAVLYAPEQGWDHTFDAYVAIPLAQFALRHSAQERIWIAEKEGRIVGCVAIVKFSENAAQLRWLLLHPALRSLGLGRRLVEEALHFCREAGYSTVFLWTVSTLPAAAGLYRSVGFRETENVTHELWGSLVTEVKYELELEYEE